MSSQTRTLVITEQAIYNIGGLLGSSIQRRILLSSVAGISMSTLQDNFFILHIPAEYDYLIESKRKTEIVTVLWELIKEVTGNRPQITFSDR
jgi:hypothetical protein